MTYLITYDLRSPVQNYPALIASIKQLGSWTKISESCWAVHTIVTAEIIRNTLMACVDQNDLLFVCSITGWAAYNLSATAVDWLSK